MRMDQEVMDGIVISYTKILQEIKQIKEEINKIFVILNQKNKQTKKKENILEPEKINCDFFKSLENE